MFAYDLARLGRGLNFVFRHATPFPHVVVDEFLTRDILDLVIAEFPRPLETVCWQGFENQRERKLASNDIQKMPGHCRSVLEALNGPAFVGFLGDLTGIAGLQADANYTGGGLHQIQRGGLLDAHIDFNILHNGLYRRLNCLLFANDPWEESWGGHLELWERDRRTVARRILPIANRLVVFETSHYSWHGHPQPLTCPEEMTRKSLATYYYAPEPESGGPTTPRDTTWAVE